MQLVTFFSGSPWHHGSGMLCQLLLQWDSWASPCFSCYHSQPWLDSITLGQPLFWEDWSCRLPVSFQPPLSYIQAPTAQPWHFLVQRALMTPLINTFQFPSWHSRPLLFSNKYSPVMFPPGHLYRPVLTQLDLILFTEFAPCFLSLSLFQMPPWITRMISFYIYCLDGHTHSGVCVWGNVYVYVHFLLVFSSSINSLRGKCQLIFCWILQSF